MVLGLLLLPLLAQAQNTIWTNVGGGAWEKGGNWSLGVAPSNNPKVYITNALSKTVTISASTPAANLTTTNLIVQAPDGATNTLLLSDNTTPLTCLAANPAVYLGMNSNQVGALVIDDGWLATTNANTNSSIYVGYDGIGEATVLNGTWEGNKLYLGYRSGGLGTLNLLGGTNTFNGNQWYIGTGIGGTGTCWLTGGVLMTVSASTGMYSVVGNQGVGTMTVSGGQWLGNDLGVGVQATSKGTLYLAGGTNLFNGGSGGFRIGSVAGSTGAVWMTGGLLATTNAAGNAQFFVGVSGTGAMTVSNGTWQANEIRIGNAATSKGTLTIAGGQVLTTMGVIAGPAAAASNQTVLITGGLLEANSLTITAGTVGNVISNSGGIYQFSKISPTITPASGIIVLNGGTISFRAVTNVNLKANWTSGLTNMTFRGDNTFRLNASTNALTPNQSYTFNTGLGYTNYTRLEMVNDATCFRGGNVTIGGGGSVLFSNTAALLTGSLTNNGGAMTVADSTVLIQSNCTLAEGSTINWSSNTVSSLVTVNGTLTVPTHATFTLTSPIGRNDRSTLFTSPNAIVGSPATWTLLSPLTHRLAIEGNTLVLQPLPRNGLMMQIR